jgi:hypothetical protein
MPGPSSSMFKIHSLAVLLEEILIVPAFAYRTVLSNKAINICSIRRRSQK